MNLGSRETTSPFLEPVESSLEITQFREAREVSTRSSKFREEHQKDWLHGASNVRSLITYTKQPASGKCSKNESYLYPGFTLSDIGSIESTRHSSLDTTNNPEPMHAENNPLLQSDDYQSPFSGLLHIPSFSFTRLDNIKPKVDISQYLLHSDFEVGEVTYFFGGLQSEPSRSLKELGIPRSTDPSLISVHFNCEMPPFVNKEVLMSPLFIRNPSFFVFNPTRSTVHDHSRPSLEEFEPGQFCEMKGTQISEFQVFFCGGFRINVDAVDFDQRSGRWIVEKSISTNDSGFILDTRTLSFTKIALVSRLELEYRGRIGAGICSNFSTERPHQNNTMFGSQSPSSTNLNDLSLNQPSSQLDTNGVTSPPSPISPISPNFAYSPSMSLSPESHSVVHATSSASLSSKSSKHSGKTQELKNAEGAILPKRSHSDVYRIDATSTFDQDNPSIYVDETLGVDKEMETLGIGKTYSNASSLRKPESKLHYRNDTKSDHGSLSSTHSAVHKVPAIFSKSSRFFHRHLLKHSSTANLSQPAQSGYSNQVKQRRTNVLTHAQAVGDVTSHHNTLKISKDISETKISETDSVTVSSNLPVSSRPEDNESLVGKSPVTRRNTALPPVSLEVKRRLDDNTEKQDVTACDVATQKSDQRSGILSICVYLFGGFFLTVTLEGRQAFRATNDFLKLELIISDCLSSDFHPEALIDHVHTRATLVPEPRGYFAHVLTSGELPNEACNIYGPECRGLGDTSNSKNTGVGCEVLSNSDRSVRTEKLIQSIIKRDAFHLIIHGGVDERRNVYGDCYYFDFITECWIQLETYAFDYYERPKTPYEDEESEHLQLNSQVENPKLVEAELRSCHHKAIVYWEGDKEYVAFVGGFNNDYLRHYDSTPYESLKFDVSRLAKLLVSSQNSNLLRIPVLNLRSQVWKFKRYFYDLTEAAKPGFIDLLKTRCMKNSRLAISGGGISIVGKQLTFCHGLVQFVPEKSEDFHQMQVALHDSSVLLGGHFHLTFPGM